MLSGISLTGNPHARAADRRPATVGAIRQCGYSDGGGLSAAMPMVVGTGPRQYVEATLDPNERSVAVRSMRCWTSQVHSGRRVEVRRRQLRGCEGPMRKVVSARRRASRWHRPPAGNSSGPHCE